MVQGLHLPICLVIVTSVFGQTTQFNCSDKLLFTPLDVKNCCKIPVIRLDRYRDECYNKSFIGGLGAKIDDNYSFLNPCAVDCVFKRAGALKNNKLNMSNMNALIKSNIPNNLELVNAVHSGFEKCEQEILNKMQQFENNRAKFLKIPCSPFAMLLSYCALRHAFLYCPQNSWVDTEVCDNARNYVKYCEPAQFGGPRQRKRYNGRITKKPQKVKH